MAKIVYEIAHVNYGDDDERTGLWFQRVTISVRADGSPSQILAREQIAKLTDKGQCSALSNVFIIDEAVKSNAFIMMPREWTFKDVPR